MADIPISVEALGDTLICDIANINLNEVFGSNVKDVLAEIEGTREGPGSEGLPIELGINLSKIFDNFDL